jgi:hypothetical protein
MPLVKPDGLFPAASLSHVEAGAGQARPNRSRIVGSSSTTRMVILDPGKDSKPSWGSKRFMCNREARSSFSICNPLLDATPHRTSRLLLAAMGLGDDCRLRGWPATARR